MLLHFFELVYIYYQSRLFNFPNLNILITLLVSKKRSCTQVVELYTLNLRNTVFIRIGHPAPRSDFEAGSSFIESKDQYNRGFLKFQFPRQTGRLVNLTTCRICSQ